MEMFEGDLREEKGSSFTVGSKVENNVKRELGTMEKWKERWVRKKVLSGRKHLTSKSNSKVKKKVRSNSKIKAKVRKRKSIEMQEKDLLTESLKDLTKELTALLAEKKVLDERLEKNNNDITKVQAEAIALRDKISKNMEKETKLEKQKSYLKDNKIVFEKKIEKVKSIRQQLQGV